MFSLSTSVTTPTLSRRPWDVEATFAAIKHNKGFPRFMMKGLDKVEIEAGLLALAHNLAKKAN